MFSCFLFWVNFICDNYYEWSEVYIYFLKERKFRFFVLKVYFSFESGKK